jgi:pantetheine-phosphate adenylyltransferase
MTEVDDKQVRQMAQLPARIAVFPLTADPPTLAHVDLIERALMVFDHIYWAIGANPAKTPLFSMQDRASMLRAVVEANGWQARVRVADYVGATVRFALSVKAQVIVRGLRSTQDFQPEFQQAVANRGISRSVDTFFFMTAPQYATISSSLVRELVSLGESIEDYVPPAVLKFLAGRSNPHHID